MLRKIYLRILLYGFFCRVKGEKDSHRSILTGMGQLDNSQVWEQDMWLGSNAHLDFENICWSTSAIDNTHYE